MHRLIIKGDVESVLWLRDKGYKWEPQLLNAALVRDHIGLATLMLHDGYVPTDCEYDSAVYRNQIELLQFCRNRKYKMDAYRIVFQAIQYGSADVLRLFENDNKIWDDLLVSKAARRGDIGMLEWLLKKGGKLTSQACEGAAATGNLPMLKYLRRKGCPWDSWTCTEAAVCGRLDIIQWAYENGCPINPDHCSRWATEDEIDIRTFRYPQPVTFTREEMMDWIWSACSRLSFGLQPA